MTVNRLPSSFRDPCGFVFKNDGIIYRQINQQYAEDYDRLMQSGLYQYLVKSRQLVEHEEVEAGEIRIDRDQAAYKYIRPTNIPYISYSYEWCFSQLKDAALTTLKIQRAALKHGMTLKDASAFNIQFVGSQPVLIDTLSFETYLDGSPWAAYKQFCQHFLGPLVLMAKCDVRLRSLLQSHIDGIPLDLTSRLLPARSLLNFGIASHIHLHAASQKRHSAGEANSLEKVERSKLSLDKLNALIESLARTVEKCEPPEDKTEWGDYYDETNYSDSGMTEKENLVKELVDKFIPPDSIVNDFGANTGRFSHIAATDGRYVIAHDIDDAAVDRHYLGNRANRVENVLPLVLDLSNPTPALGWNLDERDSLISRTEGANSMALALVHHLAISNNLSLDSIARFFSRISEKLIIEFVPKEDSQVERLLSTRTDIFPEYTNEGFKSAFEQYFQLLDERPIDGTCRTIYAFARI